MVFINAWGERYGALMLPNLIDLIIIFWKLGDGDPSADNISPHEWGLFYWFFLTELIRLIFLITLYLFVISVESQRFDCFIPGIGEYIF